MVHVFKKKKSKFCFLQILNTVDVDMGPGWHLRMVVEEIASSSSVLELEGRVCLGFSTSPPNIIGTALFTGDKIFKKCQSDFGTEPEFS